MIALTARTIAHLTDGRLLSGDPEATFTAVGTDSRHLATGALFVALSGPRFDGNRFAADALAAGAAGVVIRDTADGPPLTLGEGDPRPVIAVRDTLQALQAIAGCVRNRHPARVVAITGSVGKTTIKDMVASALGAFGAVAATPGNLNNHIGLPLTLLGTTGREDFLVLELGMSAPGEIARLTELARPDLGIVSAAAEAHLASFASVDGIADAKSELFAHLPAGGRGVANHDDPRILPRARRLAGEGLVTWGRDPEATVRVVDATLRAAETGAAHLEVRLSVGERLLALTLPTAGLHNALNAAAAIATCHALGLDLERAAAALSANFRPAPHRMNILSLPGGVTIIDDAYNANPASTRAALASVKALAAAGPCRVGLVLGTMHELGPDSATLHAAISRDAAQLGPDLVACTGPEADALSSSFMTPTTHTHVHTAAVVTELLPEITRFCRQGDGVPTLLLLKGSRSEALERVLAHLRAELDPTSPHRGGA